MADVVRIVRVLAIALSDGRITDDELRAILEVLFEVR